jgi:hypothetical protein
MVRHKVQNKLEAVAAGGEEQRVEIRHRPKQGSMPV